MKIQVYPMDYEEFCVYEIEESDIMDDKQKLKEIIDYILNNRYRRISLNEICEYTGYRTTAFNRFFSGYFGISFAKFMRKLNLRQAAKEIAGSRESLDIIGRRNGFMSKTFYAAFQDEFGISPRDFRERKLIPDMPCKGEINHRKITMSYEHLDDMVMEGYPMRAEHGQSTNLMDEAAYVFRHPSTAVDLNSKEKQFGVWWHDMQKENRLYYVLGSKTEESRPPEKGKMRIRIKGGDYAVFAIERGANYYEIAGNSRELAWYVFMVWQKLNEKQTDKMGFTYEAFDEEYSYLYVPLIRGFGGIEVEDKTMHIMEKVIQYVDKHVLEIYDADQVADHFGRSEFLICDRFQSCFRVSLPDYIRKKKLYVLAGMLQEGIIKTRDITQKYHFKTMNQFRKEFRKAFGQEWEDYERITVELPDLKSYYNENFTQLRMNIVNIDDFTVLVTQIKTSEAKEEIDLDVPGLAAFWMVNDMPTLMGSGYDNKEKMDKTMVSFYENVRKNSKDKMKYHYVVGPVEEEGNAIPENMYPVRMKGGKYLVFESVNEIDEDGILAELMRTMIRCVDYVWVYDNWMRTDFQSRISFWKYDHCKIHYYIPIYY